MPEGRRLSAALLLVLYSAAVFAALVAYEFFFPEQREPLSYFRTNWRFNGAVLRFVALFPAVALSGISAYFAFGDWRGSEGRRFSPRFLESMTSPVVSAVLAAIVYGALTLLAQPSSMDARARMASDAALFKASAERAAQAVKEKDWSEAGRYMTVCERIWPGSPETAQDRKEIKVGLDSEKAADQDGPAGLSEAALAGNPIAPLLPGVTRNTTAAEAVVLSREALGKGRYFDAHWLAVLAERLAPPQSPEYAAATRLASDAWNAIAELAPSESEKAAYSIYHRKREGYSAVVAGDWIRAYYIFDELLGRTKGDPDVRRYYDLSSRGARTVAFFADEVGATIGASSGALLLSLPSGDGRIVMRLGRLHLFADVAYGEALELVSFNASGAESFRVVAPFVKLVPMNDASAADSKTERTALLMLALDRKDEGRRWVPEWTPGRKAADNRLLLEASFGDFALAARARKGLGPLSIPDLMRGARRLGSFGFLPEAFRAEAMRRLAEPFAFLSLAVFVLAIAWRTRATRSSGLFGVFMLAVLPIAMDIVVQGARLISVTSSVLFCVLLPFELSMVAVLGFQTAFLVLAFVFLAGQRG